MLFSFVPLVVTPLFASTVLCSRFDWSVNNGKTRLRGDSFGSGYVNTTYDYIVSEWEEFQATCHALIRLPSDCRRRYGGPDSCFDAGSGAECDSRGGRGR